MLPVTNGADNSTAAEKRPVEYRTASNQAQCLQAAVDILPLPLPLSSALDFRPLSLSAGYSLS